MNYCCFKLLLTTINPNCIITLETQHSPIQSLKYQLSWPAPGRSCDSCSVEEDVAVGIATIIKLLKLSLNCPILLTVQMNYLWIIFWTQNLTLAIRNNFGNDLRLAKTSGLMFSQVKLFSFSGFIFWRFLTNLNTKQEHFLNGIIFSFSTLKWDRKQPLAPRSHRSFKRTNMKGTYK